MLLKQDIENIEKPDGICLLSFHVDKFTRLFLHPSMFSFIHSRSEQIKNGASSDFSY